MSRLDRGAVAAFVEAARRDVDDGALPSCQFALAMDGETEVAETCGDIPPDSRYLLYSVTKAITAGAAWLLIGDGSLGAETRVAEVVPEFASNGKDAVTIEHLMTHTAGIPRAPMRPLEGADRTARVARFATWRLDWEPGTRTEYHPTSASWVLAEVCERVSGVALSDLISERMTGPLALSRTRLGLSPADAGDVVDVVEVGAIDPVTASALSEVGADVEDLDQGHLLRFNDPKVRAVGVPGAGAVGTAGDVVSYFNALLKPEQTSVWDPAVVRDATTNVRNTLIDPWIRVPSNRTLGLRLAGDDGNAVLRGFGQGVGPRAFGAQGVGGQVAWADPDSGLSFCYLTNGLDADPVRAFRRQAALSALAAACAGG
ncbi:MAG: beta-lactamase family protein [Actinobacteria bacterium]|nr:beta-lactamase family protein [Actinomycetota bacterium]